MYSINSAIMLRLQAKINQIFMLMSSEGNQEIRHRVKSVIHGYKSIVYCGKYPTQHIYTCVHWVEMVNETRINHKQFITTKFCEKSASNQYK